MVKIYLIFLSLILIVRGDVKDIFNNVSQDSRNKYNNHLTYEESTWQPITSPSPIDPYCEKNIIRYNISPSTSISQPAYNYGFRIIPQPTVSQPSQFITTGTSWTSTQPWLQQPSQWQQPSRWLEPPDSFSHQPRPLQNQLDSWSQQLNQLSQQSDTQKGNLLQFGPSQSQPEQLNYWTQQSGSGYRPEQLQQNVVNQQTGNYWPQYNAQSTWSQINTINDYEEQKNIPQNNIPRIVIPLFEQSLETSQPLPQGYDYQKPNNENANYKENLFTSNINAWKTPIIGNSIWNTNLKHNIRYSRLPGIDKELKMSYSRGNEKWNNNSWDRRNTRSIIKTGFLPHQTS